MIHVPKMSPDLHVYQALYCHRRPTSVQYQNTAIGELGVCQARSYCRRNGHCRCDGMHSMQILRSPIRLFQSWKTRFWQCGASYLKRKNGALQKSPSQKRINTEVIPKRLRLCSVYSRNVGSLMPLFL